MVLTFPYEPVKELFDGDGEYLSPDGLYGERQENLIRWMQRGASALTLSLPKGHWLGTIPAFVNVGLTGLIWADTVMEAVYQEVYGSAADDNDSIRIPKGDGRTLSQQTGSVVIPTSPTSHSPTKWREDPMSMRVRLSRGAIKIPR